MSEAKKQSQLTTSFYGGGVVLFAPIFCGREVLQDAECTEPQKDFRYNH
jgi:hypothetical protein